VKTIGVHCAVGLTRGKYRPLRVNLSVFFMHDIARSMPSPVRPSLCQSVRHPDGSVNKKITLSQRWPRDAPIECPSWKLYV